MESSAKHLSRKFLVVIIGFIMTLIGFILIKFYPALALNYGQYVGAIVGLASIYKIANVAGSYFGGDSSNPEASIGTTNTEITADGILELEKEEYAETLDEHQLSPVEGSVVPRVVPNNT